VIKVADLLRVLVVEDSVDDVDLLVHELRRGGYDVRPERVDTEEAMSLALERREWDVIICDYSMPHFNAMAALVLLKATGFDVPVIVVSGTVGEDAAVETMRAGASDYVLKDNLTRLVPAVKRELLRADVRQKERTREEQRELLFNLSHDFLCVAGLDGYFKILNPQWSKVLGWTEAELMTRPFIEYVHPEDRAKTKDAMRSLEAGIQLTGFENRYMCKDGSHRWFLWNAVSLVDGKVCFATARDVTENRLAHEALLQSERRFREILEETHLFSVMLDTEGRVTFCNYALLDKTGFMREEVIGKSWFDVFLPDDVRNRVSSMFFEKIKTGDMPSYFENDIQTRSRERRLVAWNNIILRNAEGKIIGTASLGEDITERSQFDKAIKEKMVEIEKLNKFMTGRELRIIELKKEVDELLKTNDKPLKYKV
jgi:PAS domain S-box-containing protein